MRSILLCTIMTEKATFHRFLSGTLQSTETTLFRCNSKDFYFSAISSSIVKIAFMYWKTPRLYSISLRQFFTIILCSYHIFSKKKAVWYAQTATGWWNDKCQDFHQADKGLVWYFWKEKSRYRSNSSHLYLETIDQSWIDPNNCYQTPIQCMFVDWQRTG